MSALAFEDLQVQSKSTHYLVPNEDTNLWYELLKGKYIQRAAGICSAGEIGFFSMLPVVRKELVLVDHSYASLCVAMVKYAMLRELGADETKRLLTEGVWVDANKHINEALATLPEKVRATISQVDRGYDGGFSNGSKYFARPSTTINPSLKREWDKLPNQRVRNAVRKLDKVTFLHGDLTDLSSRGPFDLLYLSNALEHTSATTMRHPDLAKVAEAVRPGGYILASHGTRDTYYTRRNCAKVWEEVVVRRSTDKRAGAYEWDYILWRKPKEV